MKILKFLALAFVVVFIVFLGWFVILYKTYGLQTVLFLARSSPEMLWSYTEPLIADSTSDQSQSTNNILSVQNSNRPQPSLPPIASKHYIQNMSHTYQKLNNCGPSSAAMSASIFGINIDQLKAADVLKGSYYDKNVSAPELVNFLNAQGLKALYRVNGSAAMLEQFISRDIPVIVEQWLVKRGSNEFVGHYRVMRGYDQKTRLFTTNDSFNGPNFTIPYSQFDEWWRPFNRGYVVVYKPEQEETVKMIMGIDWDEKLNATGALAVAQAETSSIGDGYSYFNVGTNQTKLKRFKEAEESYNQALQYTFPPFFLWYQFEPLETYYEQGRYDRVFSITDNLLKQAGEVEEARYYRALSYLKQGKTSEGKAELEKSLKANPRYLPAIQALEQL